MIDKVKNGFSMAEYGKDFVKSILIGLDCLSFVGETLYNKSIKNDSIVKKYTIGSTACNSVLKTSFSRYLSKKIDDIATECPEISSKTITDAKINAKEMISYITDNQNIPDTMVNEVDNSEQNKIFKRLEEIEYDDSAFKEMLPASGGVGVGCVFNIMTGFIPAITLATANAAYNSVRLAKNSTQKKPNIENSISS